MKRTRKIQLLIAENDKEIKDAHWKFLRDYNIGNFIFPTVNLF